MDDEDVVKNEVNFQAEEIDVILFFWIIQMSEAEGFSEILEVI